MELNGPEERRSNNKAWEEMEYDAEENNEGGRPRVMSEKLDLLQRL